MTAHDLAAVPAADLSAVVNKLAARGPQDAVWHLLFALAEHREEAIPHIESALANWPSHVRPYPRKWWTDRLEGRFHEYHRVAQRISLEEAPIEPEDIPRLGPALTGVLDVDLSGSRVATGTLGALVASGALAQSRQLSLSRCGVETVRPLFFPKLDALEILDLAANPLGARTIVRLLRVRPPRLKTLNVQACKIDLPELVAELRAGRPVASAPPLDLNLSQADRVNEGLIAWAAEPSIGIVGGLDLFHVDVFPDAMRALAQSPSVRLRRFRLNRGSLGAEGVQALLHAPWATGLEDVDLFQQRAGDAVAGDLLSWDARNLRSLRLMHNDLGPGAAASLARMDLSGLEIMDLSHNRTLDDASVAAIVSNLSLVRLQSLFATGTGAGPQTLAAIARGRHLQSLADLHLGDKVGNDAVFLSATRAPLRRVTLGGLSEAGVARLAALLPEALVESGHFRSW